MAPVPPPPPRIETPSTAITSPVAQDAHTKEPETKPEYPEMLPEAVLIAEPEEEEAKIEEPVTPQEPPITTNKPTGSRLEGLKQKLQNTGFKDLTEIVVDKEEQRQKVLLSSETVTETWNQSLEHLRPLVSSAFITTAEKVQLSWSEPVIEVEVTTKLAEGLLTENKMKLATALQYITGRTDVEINIVVNRKYQEEESTRKKYLSPKERFRQMAEQNPALLELQKRLDLDLQ